MANALDSLAADLRTSLERTPLVEVAGRVTDVSPASIRVEGLSPFVGLGDVVRFRGADTGEIGEVVRVERKAAIVKPFGAHPAIRLGQAARRVGPFTVAPHPSWKGRILNALAEPLDGGGPLQPGPVMRPTEQNPPAALDRGRVTTPLRTGIKVLDIFCPICAGQRIGIFAGSGVGKSTMLAMLAGSRGFDTVVIALVGERGREVREFLEDSLGENRPRTVTVVATGDESPMMRRLSPKLATTIAESFRDAGENVLLIVDSVTRYAHAARDVALAAGEPALARGYPPSVFSELPKLLERSGPGPQGSGSITGVFAVLVDGDDHNDPIADAIRGTLDGHVVLDRRIAAQARYPAVDVLASLSRLAHQAWTSEQRTLVTRLREMVARFEDTRDLRAMGGYQSGADAELDQAVAMVPRIYQALGQTPHMPRSEDAFRDLATALQPKGK